MRREQCFSDYNFHFVLPFKIRIMFCIFKKIIKIYLDVSGSQREYKQYNGNYIRNELNNHLKEELSNVGE